MSIPMYSSQKVNSNLQSGQRGLPIMRVYLTYVCVESVTWRLLPRGPWVSRHPHVTPLLVQCTKQLMQAAGQLLPVEPERWALCAFAC